MAIDAFPGDAVCLATGGCGIVFGKSTNSVINTGTAASAAYQQGACYANGEFIQVHPTAIPGADKLRLISESVRGEGGRVWVPRDPKERRAGRDVPESARDYFLEEKYPGYGNLVPRDIASRELFKKCFHEKRGVYNPTSGENENEVYLDVTHLPREVLRKKLAGVLEIYEKFVGEDPYANPMRVFPAVHYSMGGLWVDFERAPNGVARHGLAAQPGDEHPGPLRRAARSTTSTTAPTGSAPTRSSRASGAAWSRARRSRRTARTCAGARGTCRRRSSTRREKREQKKYEAILAMDGDENPYALHEELAQTMLVDCTIERHNADARRGAREDRGDRRAREQRRRDRHGDRQDEPGRAVRAAPAAT